MFDICSTPYSLAVPPLIAYLKQRHKPLTRMRDIIKKTLQLGFAQHLCLFTLADEFSPLCSILIERRFLL